MGSYKMCLTSAPRINGNRLDWRVREEAHFSPMNTVDTAGAGARFRRQDLGHQVVTRMFTLGGCGLGEEVFQMALPGWKTTSQEIKGETGKFLGDVPLRR